VTWWPDTYGKEHPQATTLAAYRSMAKEPVILGLGATALADLTPKHVADWQAHMLQNPARRGRAPKAGAPEKPAPPLAAKRVLNARVMLHAALEEAVRMGMLPSNPVARIRAPKVTTKRVDSFSREQVGALMAKAEGHALAPMIATAWQTGLRLGELCGIRWADVDLDAGTARVARTAASTGAPVFMQEPKSLSPRSPCPGATVALLRAHGKRQAEDRLRLGPAWQDNDLVFATSRGTALHAGRVEGVFNDFRNAARLPCHSFHAPRHMYASLALLAGVPLETASGNLGHGGISFTKRVYAHVLPEAKRAGADLMGAVVGRV
jgi:integrase